MENVTLIYDLITVGRQQPQQQQLLPPPPQRNARQRVAREANKQPKITDQHQEKTKKKAQHGLNDAASASDYSRRERRPTRLPHCAHLCSTSETETTDAEHIALLK
jgi:hypothetical protein